jgi:peroxiredoxin
MAVYLQASHTVKTLLVLRSKQIGKALTLTISVYTEPDMASKLSAPQLLGIVLLGLFTVFITWKAKSLDKRLHESTDASMMVNKKAAEFSLPTLDSKAISLGDYRGKKKVVVSYWASWCGPCRMELPILAEFYKKYHKDSSDFEILAISIDEDRGSAETYANSAKLPFPVLLDPDSRVAESYSVEAIPSLFVIDTNGTIVYGSTGLDEAIDVQLAHHLGMTWSPMGIEAASDDSSR